MFTIIILYKFTNLCFTFFRYEAGDHAAVYPTNDSRIVEKIGELLDADLDTVFTLTNVDGKKLIEKGT